MFLRLLTITVVVIGIPALVVAFVLARHFLHVRRRMLAAKDCVCPRCGYPIGVDGLQEADHRWAEHVATLHRKHPQTKFRLVRVVDAICIACGVQLRFNREIGTFGEPIREMTLETGDTVLLEGVLWLTSNGCVLRNYVPLPTRPDIRGDVLLKMPGLRTFLTFYVTVFSYGEPASVPARVVGRLAFDRAGGFSIEPVDRFVAIPVPSRRYVITAQTIAMQMRAELHQGRDKRARELSSL